MKTLSEKLVREKKAGYQVGIYEYRFKVKDKDRAVCTHLH